MLVGTGLMIGKVMETRRQADDLPKFNDAGELTKDEYDALEEKHDAQQATAVVLGVGGASLLSVGLVLSFK